MAPLQAHVEHCPTCRAELEAQRQIVTGLERLPQLTPTPLFAYHVMQRVQVFEPWHAAALDSLRRFIPRSQPARIFAGATAVLAAAVLTMATVWIANRVDAVAFFADVATERARVAALNVGSTFLLSTLGEGALTAIRNGGVAGLALAATGALGAVFAVAIGLRAITTSGRQRRI